MLSDTLSVLTDGSRSETMRAPLPGEGTFFAGLGDALQRGNFGAAKRRSGAIDGFPAWFSVE
jgi:hypothetical protein